MKIGPIRALWAHKGPMGPYGPQPGPGSSFLPASRLPLVRYLKAVSGARTKLRYEKAPPTRDAPSNRDAPCCHAMPPSPIQSTQSQEITAPPARETGALPKAAGRTASGGSSGRGGSQAAVGSCRRPVPNKFEALELKACGLADGRHAPSHV